MKKSILLGATLALVGLAIVSTNTQTQTTTSTSYIESSTVVGSKIKDSRGEEVGVIKDFVLDRNSGCLAYVVVSTGKGGVLSTSSKTVAAPWAVFSVSSDPRVYTVRVEREKIYSAPVWESSRVEEYSRTDYLNNVYGYYGIAAPRFNAEMSVGVTNTTNTTTNPTTTTSTATTQPDNWNGRARRRSLTKRPRRNPTSRARRRAKVPAKLPARNPASRPRRAPRPSLRRPQKNLTSSAKSVDAAILAAGASRDAPAAFLLVARLDRSEERRVGKECGSELWPDH